MADDKNLKKLRALFGEEFPGFDEKDGDKWRLWLEAQWKKQLKVMRDKRLHWSRHRHFRQGRQWISSRDGRTWHEPGHDKNTIRSVLNLVGPALDYRLGILREQRPGFRYEALGTTVEAKEQAQAQQTVVEYYFHILRTWIVFQDALQAAQTDGCAYINVFKDKSAGPKQQRVTLVPPNDERFAALQSLGYEVREDGQLVLPLNESGQERKPGEEAFEFHEGDIAHRVVYAFETVADPEAKTVNGPYDKAKWMVVRRVRDIESARLETNDPGLEAEVKVGADPLDEAPDTVAMQWSRGLPPYPTNRRRSEQGVYEYLVFFNGGVSDVMPKGAWRKVLGKKLLDGEDELPGGVIPLARVTDGSADPELYPRPVMSDYLGDQISINALVSMALQHAKLLGAGRVLSQKDTVLDESFTSISASLIEYSGIKPEFLTPPRVSGDVWQLIDFFVKKFEDKTSWNDLARGQVSGTGSFQDVSGRAILSARELFERSLGPMVRAATDGITEWADLVVLYAQDLFETPRLIPVMGGRSDLAKRIDRSKLGTRPIVFADPETMMPLPRAMRNQMLFDMYQQGLITLDTYKQRAPFAFIRDVYAGEQTQAARAQTINEVLSERWEELSAMAEQDPLVPFQPEQGVPVLWSDDPAVHINALNEIVLDDRKPWKLRTLAMTRVNVYGDLLASKQGGVPDPETGIAPPPAPVPVEVIGAPADLPVKPAQSSAQAAAGEPSQQPLSAPTPEIAPTTQAGQLEAQPLGGFGNVERELAGEEALPR